MLLLSYFTWFAGARKESQTRLHVVVERVYLHFALQACLLSSSYISEWGKRKWCPLIISFTLSYPKKMKREWMKYFYILFSIFIPLFCLPIIMLCSLLHLSAFIVSFISFDFIDKELGLEHLNLRKGSLWYVVSSLE